MCSHDRRILIARSVVHYLLRRPEARDTLAGIGQWWLQADGVQEELHQALEYLIEQRFLKVWENVGGEDIYGLSQGFLDIIQPLFREWRES